MFLSFQKLYERTQSLSADTDSTTLTLFKALLNEGISKAYAEMPAEYFLKTAADATVASQESYPLPFNCAQIHSIIVTISSVDYVAQDFPGSENQWLALAASNTESAYPYYYFIKRNEYLFYPIPSTSDYTITIRYQCMPTELTADDSATSTIKTLVASGTTVTSNAAAFTAAMVGRYFRIDADLNWYQIASYTSTTVIELEREYGGAAISAGTSAYTIGEMSLLPEPCQEMPIDYALFIYYLQKKDDKLASIYKAKWDEGLVRLREYAGNMTTSGVIGEDIVIPIISDWPTNLS